MPSPLHFLRAVVPQSALTPNGVLLLAPWVEPSSAASSAINPDVPSKVQPSAVLVAQL